MNLSIPRNNPSELIMYIWKIIDLPEISKKDLLFRISFDFFLFPPYEATEFIQTCINNKLLVEINKEKLALSPALSEKVQNWQKERKGFITSKISSTKKKYEFLQNFETKDSASNFNKLLKIFLDKQVIDRAVTISDNSFTIKEADINKGILKAEVAGSKEQPYIIEFDINNKTLRHNCHDFMTKRAENKKFCKHLTKLFLVLKESDENKAIFFLKKVIENINEWEFTS